MERNTIVIIHCSEHLLLFINLKFTVVGLQEGLKMMLSGSSVRPDKAKKLQLVDLVVDPASLEEVAITQVRKLKNMNKWIMKIK